MKPEDLNDFRHVIIPKLMDISRHARRIGVLIDSTVYGHKTIYSHISEIYDRVTEIEGFLKEKKREIEDD